jgi:hypothetical protein
MIKFFDYQEKSWDFSIRLRIRANRIFFISISCKRLPTEYWPRQAIPFRFLLNILPWVSLNMWRLLRPPCLAKTEKAGHCDPAAAGVAIS